MNQDQFYQLKANLDILRENCHAVKSIRRYASQGLKSPAQLRKEWDRKWIATLVFLVIYAGYLLASLWFYTQGIGLGMGFMLNMVLGTVIVSVLGAIMLFQAHVEKHWETSLNRHLLNYEPYDPMGFVNLRTALVDKNVFDCDLILDWAMTEHNMLRNEINRQVSNARHEALMRSRKKSFLMPVL